MPGMPLKICAIPMASETAPPVRPVTVSRTAASSAGRFVTDMPSAANTFGGVLIAK